MLTSRKYTVFDLIGIPLRVIPVQTAAAVGYMLVDALMPAYQTLVMAYFINTATDIVNGRAEYSFIYRPLALIMGYVIVTHLLPSLMQLVEPDGAQSAECAAEAGDGAQAGAAGVPAY